MIRIAVILAALLLCACVPRSALPPAEQLPSSPPAPPVPPLIARPVDPPAATPADDRIAVARSEIARLRADLARQQALERAAVADRDDARREASLAPVRQSIAWATWIGSTVGAMTLALLVASLVWSIPVGRKALASLAGAGFGFAALAQGIGFALPWFGLVGVVALILAALVAAALLIARLWPVLIAHARLADVAEQIDGADSSALAKAKAIAAQVQGAAGVVRQVALARGKR